MLDIFRELFYFSAASIEVGEILQSILCQLQGHIVEWIVQISRLAFIIHLLQPLKYLIRIAVIKITDPGLETVV